MSTQPTETDAFEQVCETLVERILDGEIDGESLEDEKLEVCSMYSSPKVPKNTELLDYAPIEHRDELEPVLQRKPVRTASGVSPVAIMTSPHMCPHGKCLYCPGGPASEFSSAQSYTGHEPAAARGVQNDYDPYGQVTLRLNQLREIGHPVDKVELILMGGTMTARSHDYQEWFVKRALCAMNDFDVDAVPEPAEGVSFAQSTEEYEFRYLEDVIANNETADVRNIGTTFETKPDWCDPEQIDRMLALGGTKVEVGVQTTYERINREMHRGHGVQASIDANRRLRNAGFKVGFHMMPGQPGMSQEMCIEDFRRIFEQTEWKPDYLKIYPTLVVKGTITYDMWRQGEYEPLTNEEAADLVARIKEMIPKYTRLQRVQRDIPADFIEAGVWKSNLRQLARQRLHERGGSCDCIRCREVGMNDATPSPDRIERDVLSYEACGGTEHFISYEDTEIDCLIGFCRLRFPGDSEVQSTAGSRAAPDDSAERSSACSQAPPGDITGTLRVPVSSQNASRSGDSRAKLGETNRRELANAALIRELHVYGTEIGVGDASDEYQHKGYGKRLLEHAERVASDAGYEKLSVISGIGARQYYREKHGYYQDGPYVSTRL